MAGRHRQIVQMTTCARVADPSQARLSARYSFCFERRQAGPAEAFCESSSTSSRVNSIPAAATFSSR